MDPTLDWTNVPPESWAHLVAGVSLLAIGFTPTFRLPSLWRGVARGLAVVVVLRIILLGNPWVWQFYGRVLDPQDVGWRQADVIRLQRDRQQEPTDRPRYLAVGSSQTDRIYGSYAAKNDDLDVFILAAMMPIDMVLYEEAIARRRPEHVLLYLSDFDLAREPPGNAMVMAPRQGPRLLSLWKTMRSLPMGAQYDGTMAELLLGELFPESKYGFVLRGVCEKTIDRVAQGLGRPEPPAERASAEQLVTWLRESFDARYIELNLSFLRKFLTNMSTRGIDVVIVEGQYSPLASNATTRVLAERARHDLSALAGEIEGVRYLASDDLLALTQDDFSDLTHVTEETGQRLTRAVIARVEGRHPLDVYNPATDAVPREPSWWMERVDLLEERIRRNPAANVLFVGNSITQGWEREGRGPWQRLTEEHVPLNLGIGGDRTEHVLWRLRRMDLSRLQPEAVVLLIGTNNCVRTSQTAAEIAEGIAAIVTELRGRLPDTHVLLHAILPRGEPDDPARAKADQVNHSIQKLAEDPFVQYLDLGHLFLDQGGRVRHDLMPDLLHLSEAGYALWVDALMEPLAAMASAP